MAKIFIVSSGSACLLSILKILRSLFYFNIGISIGIRNRMNASAEQLNVMECSRHIVLSVRASSPKRGGVGKEELATITVFFSFPLCLG